MGPPMDPRDFTSGFTVDQAPDIVFAAICNVRGWWSADITGNADRVGDQFVHRVRDLHRCEIAIKQMVPGRKIVWTVLDNHFSFTRDATEWTRSEEHTSELQSLMRISYAVFCLKKKNTQY